MKDNRRKLLRFLQTVAEGAAKSKYWINTDPSAPRPKVLEGEHFSRAKPSSAHTTTVVVVTDTWLVCAIKGATSVSCLGASVAGEEIDFFAEYEERGLEALSDWDNAVPVDVLYNPSLSDLPCDKRGFVLNSTGATKLHTEFNANQGVYTPDYFSILEKKGS